MGIWVYCSVCVCIGPFMCAYGHKTRCLSLWCVCVCMRQCVCVCACLCVRLCVCVCMCVGGCIYICMDDIYIYIYIYVCMCVFVDANIICFIIFRTQVTPGSTRPSRVRGWGSGRWCTPTDTPTLWPMTQTPGPTSSLVTPCQQTQTSGLVNPANPDPNPCTFTTKITFPKSFSMT